MTALRLLGAACVSLACTAWGLLRARALRQRARTLYAVGCELEQLGSEINELRAPLPEIVSRLKTETPAPCRAWLSALSDALETETDARFSFLWQRTLETHAPPGLGAETRERLGMLAASLGRYDAPEQCQALERCLRAVEREQALAEEKARTQGRLCVGLGAAAGLLLAVLLL